MSFEQLWAPWRLSYIKQDRDAAAPERAPLSFLPGADPECFICRDVVDTADRENLVVHRGERCLTILNRFPYNNGHLLVAPKSHRAELGALEAADHLEIMETTARLIEILRRTMNPDGFNVGLNLGRMAGAGLPGHLHWHIVPRWNGDTNFMPVLAGVNVIPQSLDALWSLLTDALRGIAQ
ncbi:MAG: HIT domain-containing protein [Pirellulales bacterium]|nr:HIT domain-containing protein [Pirellulales bacterium]